MKTNSFIAALLSVVAGACGPDLRNGDPMGPGPGDDMPPGDDDPMPPPVASQCQKMDIVFVVDDSGSMSEEQSNLASNFPMFATLLSNYVNGDGQKVDFRIGITTTGKTIDYTVALGMGFPPIMQHEEGDNGAFRNNCGGAARWLESSDPTMTSSLGCRANVGTSGPGIEMPLLMTKYALAERAADTNAGFVRADALLAVVMITDENDASTTQNNFTMDPTSGASPTDFHAQDLVSFLDTLKGNRTRWAAAAIAGDGNCTSSFGDAVDAARIKEFVNLANAQGTTQATFSSICDGNLTNGLMQALATFQSACGGIIY